MTEQTPATEAGRRPEEVLGDEDTWAYHPPEPVISREDWDQAIDTTGMKRVGPDPQTPATEAE